MPKGSCLCGGVSFEIGGSIGNSRYCHCTNCRKFSGTAFAAWGLIAVSDFVLTSPESNLGKYDSGGGGLRVFCSSCGSPLWFEPAGLPTLRGVPLGVFDSGDVPAPTMHVWTRSRPDWDTITDELPQHETHP